MKKHFALFSALALAFSIASPVIAADDITTLRRQLEEQRALIQAQQQQLAQQAQALDRLSERLDEMTAGQAAAAQAVSSPKLSADDTPKVAARPETTMERDEVGDLNSESIKSGEFPGSFMIPGPGKISLRIGGFVKTVAIADSDAETMGADFLPSTLGTRRSDKDGAFSLDATITRLNLDARAPTPDGRLRGYVEWDLNDSNDGSVAFKMRHAYGAWINSYGTLTAGHTWSTLMDLKILPEGLTEPTMSGPIFMRQAQIRWSQPLDSQFTLHAAIEDPNSNDVFSDEPTLGKTDIPDVVMGLEYDRAGIGHLRLNGILRHIEVDMPAGGDDDELGWGMTLTGHLNFFEKDRFRCGGAYGQGLGRYLLGIQSIDGSAIDPVRNELRLRDNWGAFASYEHHWTEKYRSTAKVGYAHSKPFGWQAAGTLENTMYTGANLMCQVFPYLTLGIEYDYGRRENKDNSDLDNHRLMLGVQVY